MGEAIILGRRPHVNYAKDWEFTTNDTATLITKYIGSKYNVIVPNKINGKPVIVQNSSSNSSGVFTNNRNINSVTFRSGVTIANGNMSNMFAQCLGLNSVYDIPDNVTNMSWTFYSCFNFSEPPVLPANLQNMYSTFRSCHNLLAAPEIPETVTNMAYTFYACENYFTTATVIPNGVTDLAYTFAWCKHLNVLTMPKLHNNIKTMNMTFAWTWMKKAPEIPESVTSMVGTFYNCPYLTTSPNIPVNVTDMRQTFEGCIRFVSAPEIPENVTNMAYTFRYCRNLVTAPNIPENVTNMSYTFCNCTNLKGNIYVKSNRINNTSMQNCFLNTALTKNVYVPCQGLDVANNTWNAAFDATYGINGKNGVTVYSDCELDFEYTTNDTATLVTKYIGNKNDVIVPSIINGQPVIVQSGNNVFGENENITSITFGDNVGIENNDMDSMFYYCTKLQSVSSIPENVTKMTYTFEHCHNLTLSPVIPENVTTMCGTFIDCYNLVSAPKIPVNVTNMTATFLECSNLITAPIIPENVISMGGTFGGCINLVGDIYIKSNRLNNTAMQDCFNDTTLVKNVYIPCVGLDATNNTWNAAFNSTYGINGKNGVTVFDDCTLDWEFTTNDTTTLVTKYIGTKNDVVVPNIIGGQSVVIQNSANNTFGVFTNNQNIKSVTFSEGVSIANGNMSNMFANCRRINNISNVPGNITNMTQTYYYCKNLKVAPAIPDGIESLPSTFMGCSNVTKTPAIPNTVKNLYRTFQECVRLTSVSEIPEGVINMRSTFCACTNLKTAPIIPASVKDMYCTFQNCWNITSAGDILASATNILAAYQNCRSLTIAPNILGDVTSLPSTFSYCTNLVAPPNIPENVTNMAYTFYNCNNLTTAPNIPVNVINVFRTFGNCTNLTAAPVIPANVTDMDRTFERCTNLTGNIYIKSNRLSNTAMQNCFNGTDLLKNVYIPCVGLDATNNTWNAAFNATYGINGKNGVTVIDDCELDWEYTTNDTATLLTSYIGAKNDVVVPSTLNGKPTILQSAYESFGDYEGPLTWKTQIKSVTFKDGVSIENNSMKAAFYGCISLQNVVGIPANVTDMYRTFLDCESLTTAPVIPASVEIMDGTFTNCYNLTEAPEIPANVTSMGSTFENCTSLTTAPVIPANVTSMAYTFSGCQNLTEAPEIPANVTSMNSTFEHCTSLTTAPVIPANVESMRYTFYNCYHLTGNIYIKSNRMNNTAMTNCFLNTSLQKNVYIPCVGLDATNNTWNAAFNATYGINGKNGVTVIDDCTLDWEYTTNDTATLVTKYIGAKNDVVVPNMINGKPTLVQSSVNFDSGVFINNQNITSVTFQEGVSIENSSMYGMFSNCRNIKSISGIPASVTNLSGSFRYCVNLTSAPTIPSNVKDIAFAFHSCSNLTSAPELPSSIISMNSAFSSCVNLTEAPTIPSNVTSLQSTFAYCTNLKTAPEIPEGVTDMWMSFKNCKSLTNPPVLPSNVSTLQDTFAYCFNLKLSPVIPSSVVYMSNTFRSCYNISSAPDIPESVKDMYGTFQDCVNLTGNIYIKSNRMNNTSMRNCFMNTTLPKNVYIPCIGLDATNNTWNAAFNTTYGINGKNGVTVIDDCVLYENDENDFEYTTNSTATLVTKYIGTRNDVVVPGKINGKPVVLQNIHLYYSSIGGVFCDNTNITSVRFLPGVTFANQNTRLMFSNCSNLKSVRGFTSGTINDMSSMFANCSSLTSVSNIPFGVTNMYSTFENCKQLGGNIIIESKSVSNLRYCFADTTRVKKVYLPFNSTTHSTANTYINGVNGVTVYDINTYTG